MSARRFLRTTLLVMALVVAGFLAVTVAVDPYDYWGMPRMQGLTLHKPGVHSHLKLAKTGQYLREKPRTVLAGNSRVDVGLDPKDAAWPTAFQLVYNFGMPGEGLASVAEVLTTAMAQHRPERVYLGIDFLDFLVSEDMWTGYDVSRLEPRRRGALERLRGFVKTSLSLDALVDSVLTLAEQRKTWPADTRRDGFSPLENYHSHVAQEGHAALFAQRTRETVVRLMQQPRRMEWSVPGRNPSWVRLEQFLARARAQGVEVVLFTFPYHAELLETLHQTGRWPELRQWLEQLATVAAREEVPLWSFIGYNRYTAEPVPPPGDRRTHMRWYWEAGHFKPELGGLVIARMTGADAPAGFGRRVTPSNVQDVLAALEAEGRAYRARPDAATSRVVAYVRAIRGEAGSSSGLPEVMAVSKM